MPARWANPLRPFGRLAPALLAIAFTVPAAAPAGAENAELLDRWYAALMRADRATLASMLTDDAQITLEDVDITQTKQEFIASMDEWEESVKDATERHKLDSEVEDSVTMLVCYAFVPTAEVPKNEILMRETFALGTDGLISESTQATLAEDCEGF